MYVERYFICTAREFFFALIQKKVNTERHLWDQDTWHGRGLRSQMGPATAVGGRGYGLQMGPTAGVGGGREGWGVGGRAGVTGPTRGAHGRLGGMGAAGQNWPWAHKEDTRMGTSNDPVLLGFSHYLSQSGEIINTRPLILEMELKRESG